MSLKERSGVGEAPRRSQGSHRRLGLIVGIVVLVLATSVLAGTWRRSSAASGRITLTLYSGQHEQTTDALVAAFTKRTGIAVSVRSDDEDTLVDNIVAESTHSPADVIYTENSPALEYLEQHHLLMRLPPATLSRVPARYRSSTGAWVGVSARVSVIVYNPKLITRRQLPRSVLALADARYRGKLAVAPGETDFQPIVTSVLEAKGRARTLAWLDGLKANASGHIYPDNETITNDVNRGIVAFGVINQYYWYRLRAEIGASGMHSALAFFAPRDPGYVIDVSGAGVLSSSKHPDAARRLVAFLVSRAGQELLVHSQSFEYPLVAGIPAPKGEIPFAALRPHSISLTRLGSGQRAIQLLLEVQLL